VHGLHTGWSALLLCRQESHGPDLVQAAMTCQCQPQSSRHAQCFVFALTLARKELSDDQRFNFKPEDKRLEVTKMHSVQSIGYAAAYPAYPLNPPLKPGELTIGLVANFLYCATNYENWLVLDKVIATVSRLTFFWPTLCVCTRGGQNVFVAWLLCAKLLGEKLSQALAMVSS